MEFQPLSQPQPSYPFYFINVCLTSCLKHPVLHQATFSLADRCCQQVLILSTLQQSLHITEFIRNPPMFSLLLAF